MSDLNYQQQAGAMQAHFKDQWDARVGIANVPIAVANGPKLKLGSVDPTTFAWVEFSCINTVSTIDEVGGRNRTMRGRVRVRIFTPLALGQGRSQNYGDIVSDIWDTAHVNGLDTAIELEAPEFVTGGPDPALPYWMDTSTTWYRTWMAV